LIAHHFKGASLGWRRFFIATGRRLTMTRGSTLFVIPRVGVAALAIAVGACGPGLEEPGREASPVSIGEIQSDDPEIREAIAEAGHFVEAAPLDPGAWFELGRKLQANGLYVEAEGAYDNVIELQPGHRRAAYLKAVSQHRLGRLDEAVRTLEALSESGSTDAAMERALATWSLEVGDLDGAKAAATRAIELDPMGRGGHALLARFYIENGQPSEACAHLEPLVERTIRHAYFDFLYATALMADGRQSEAQEIMPKIPPKPPLWPDPHLDAVNELAAGYPTAMRETKELLSAGDLDRALQRAEELHLGNADSVAAAILYALCLRDSGRYQEALEVLKDELDRRPRHPELLYQTAAVLTMAAQASGSGEQLPAALALAEAAIEVDPGRYQSHGVAGAIFLWMGRLDEALAAFERCAEIDATSPAHCSTKVGNVLIMNGRVDEGLAVLEEAVNRQPLEAAPTVTYAVQLNAAGRSQELRTLLDRLQAGGSVSSGLLEMVEGALESGATIRPPQLTAGAPD
jgi:tetratricopeptide (TPR) repeat protein